MWKCFNRGVWETIDRSVNVFKADTSNGTCLISSLAKDFDVNSDELVGNKSQPCSTGQRGNNLELTESDVPLAQQSQCKDLNKTVVLHSACSSKDYSHDAHHLESVKPSQDLDNPPVFFFSRNIRKRSFSGRCPTKDFTNSRYELTVTDKRVLACSCDRVPAADLDVRESHKVNSGRRFCSNDCSEINVYWKLHLNSLSGSANRVSFAAEGKDFQLNYSAYIRKSLTKASFFSLLCKPMFSPDAGNVIGKKLALPNEKTQPIALFSDSHAKSNCVLELPFLCCDLGRLKGLNNSTLGWLMKRGSDFREGDSGRGNGDRSDESEETKEEAWRQCNVHQSFLEAIGLSSAVLFGWFLGQFPFHHIYGGARRDDNSENKRKCCIVKSLKRFLLVLKDESALPLKILPSATNGISQDSRGKNHSTVNGRETASIIKPYDQYDTCPPCKFSVLDINDGNIFERPGDDKNVPTTRDNRYHENHSKLKLLSVNEEHKNVIPMPWREDSGKNLVYGPITFEEAVQEASKKLEEAQAEVLLTLALEKLDAGCNLTQNEPLPADLFQSSASLGSTAAAFNLGICYEKGVGGVVKNLTQAYHWYKQASEQGHVAATYNLALFHANGLGGLHPNTHLAKQLLLKASSMGSEEATNALHVLSSFNSSEISHNDGNCSSSVSLNQGNRENDDSFVNHSMDSSLEVINNRYNTMSMYSKSYPLSGMSVGSVSQSSEYFKKISDMLSPKLGHIFTQNSITLNNPDFANEPLEEDIFDGNHRLKSTCTGSGSVQLLAL